MSKLLQDSAFFCLAISLIGYEIGIILRQKTKLALCNPLLISIVFVIIILKVTNIKYEVYEDGSQLLSYLLTPSTVCLAIPLYQQMGLLKKNMKAILAGILSGVFTSLAGVWVFSTLFHLDKQIYATLLPKSITTAIGMGISEELGGIVTITVAAIIIRYHRKYVWRCNLQTVRNQTSYRNGTCDRYRNACHGNCKSYGNR